MEKNMALAKIDRAIQSGALVYASREAVSELPEQYSPIISELIFKKDDFAAVGQGNFYPSKATTNRIAEATGISFTENCGTKTKGNWSGVKVFQMDGVWQADGEFSIVGYAQGIRMKPDGTWRSSPIQEYEFSITDRFNLDRLGNEKYPPKDAIAARKKLLELKKFSTQRASTGAELTVVRYLAAIPTAFKEQDILRPMIFDQFIENPEYKAKILNELSKTPDGRLAIANNLMGVKNELFGPSNQIADTTHHIEAEEVTEPQEPSEPEGIFSDQAMETGELSPLDLAKLKLEEYTNDPTVQAVPSNIQGIKAMIENPNATIEEVNNLISTIENWKKGRA